MKKDERDRQFIANQIKNAFDFIQKLYNESAFLIKEIEGHLADTDYRFTILKTSGYAISSRSSNGLEPNNVKFWLLRKFAVAFVEEDKTTTKKGQNFTEINDTLKVLYFRIVLNDTKEPEPQLIFGVFYDIKPLRDWIKKFENLMGYFEYKDDKIFAQLPDLDSEDRDLKIKGKFSKISLLDIGNSEELAQKVIEPVLERYKDVL